MFVPGLEKSIKNSFYKWLNIYIYRNIFLIFFFFLFFFFFFEIVVNSLLAAIPSIANVFLVCIVFWLIFSILGVQLFGGKFFKCVNQNNERIDAAIIPNKTMCLAYGHQWKNSNANFDNALNGFLPLFQVAVFEGWIEIMRDAVDATEVILLLLLFFKDRNYFIFFTDI